MAMYCNLFTKKQYLCIYVSESPIIIYNNNSHNGALVDTTGDTRTEYSHRM